MFCPSNQFISEQPKATKNFFSSRRRKKAETNHRDVTDETFPESRKLIDNEMRVDGISGSGSTINHVEANQVGKVTEILTEEF